ncbi:unnamed protein product [Malus baccata var. baccata]
MIGNSLAQVSACPTLLSLSSPTKVTRIRATSADTGHSQQSSSSSEKNNPLAVVLDVPRTIWRQTLRPLSEFGFGCKSIWEGGVGKSIWEGGVGLFLVSGVMQTYKMMVCEYMNNKVNTPHTNVKNLGFGKLCVLLVEDDKTVIPRNALIEIKQSGLLMETKIDITPRDPLLNISVGPLHPECSKEGLIVFDRQKMRGHQGVILDALVGIFTRLGREVGIVNTYSLAERVASVIEEAKPLLILNISSDILGFTGDEATRKNIKLLINSSAGYCDE